MATKSITITQNFPQVPHRRTGKFNVPDLAGMDPVEAVKQFYASMPNRQKKPLPDLTQITLSTILRGLGDTLVMTDSQFAAKACGKRVYTHAANEYFEPIMQYCPEYKFGHTTWLAHVHHLVSQYACGPGHVIQRIQRAWQLPVDPVPKPRLVCPGVEKDPKLVIIHLEPGDCVDWQRKHEHPQARQLYSANKVLLERFIANHQELKFVQVGHEDAKVTGAEYVSGDVEWLIKLMAGATWFIGVDSGPMHIAAAFGLKATVIVNLQHPDLLILPQLVDTGLCELHWLYPQHCHLHQDGAGPLAPLFTYETLEQAHSGLVYPFWRTGHLAGLLPASVNSANRKLPECLLAAAVE